MKNCACYIIIIIILSHMEVENHLFVVENGLPFGAILHFHVSSRECTHFGLYVGARRNAARQRRMFFGDEACCP